ncbi:protein kinase domain-containing protein [Arsenicicoccus dermatophilus]|uniref:protein kinase domain-containing protein n=1 Tax=Arsenicicoccus dermatophilus TaxID=1076331 RepID=UPI001F4CCF69|nr:protein kinase [Arsenicicoccus dermatophilus]MCH8611892.1 protein kinase [Arsenicicoccus dermatophilus]
MSADTVLAGRYRLDRSIGRGGMGQVWSAHDLRLQRQVAVKTVDLAAAGDDVAAARFQQEAQATAALSHPNIVTIFDNGMDGTTAFLVMELLAGPSLEELVQDEGPLPVDQALEHAQDTASALGAAHRAGIVHRDIKPSNLMLDARGALKIVDFGIARLDQARTSRLTATAMVIGSAPYLSPEQATGGIASPQSDLYSLGCVLMALLTGEPPFEGEHALAILHQHLSATPPRPSDLRPGVPAAVDDLVAQLLAKRPEERPASAGDVAARIAAIRRGVAPRTTVLPQAGAAAATTVLPPSAGAGGAPVRPPTTGAAQVAGPVTVPATHPTTGATPQPMTGTAGVVPEPRRRRGGLAALLFVLLLLAATVGLLWKLGILSGTGTPATPAPTTTPVPAVTTATTTTEEPTPTATTTTRRPRRTSPAHTRTATTRPTVTVTETPRTPTDTPTDVSPTPDPTWTTAATASVGALRQAVDAATLPKPLERDVNSTLDRLSGAVDKADAAAARDAIGELDSTLREAAEQGVVDDGTETLVTGALNAVNQLLPPA